MRMHDCPACGKAWECRANLGWPFKAEPLPCVLPDVFPCPKCAQEGAA